MGPNSTFKNPGVHESRDTVAEFTNRQVAVFRKLNDSVEESLVGVKGRLDSIEKIQSEVGSKEFIGSSIPSD
jgi:hypothetical protein